MKTIPIAVLTSALAFVACTKSNRTLIQNAGSDTMLEVAQALAETYGKEVSGVSIAVKGGGSQVGISGIIDGTIDLANSSRKLKPEEVEAARKKNHEPVEHHVGYDGIAIYVHKENPITSLTIEQLKQIYMDNGKLTKWSQLGVTVTAGMSDEIILVSRQSNSGTYEYFRESVLGDKKTNFRLGTRDMNGSKDVVDLVTKTRSAIGYSGLAYANAEVKLVPVAKKDGEKAILPTIDSVLDKSYPIARPLFMYTVGQPKPAVQQYLDWIKSDAGQRVLVANHYPPLRKL
ncbi:MAG: phosphate ABC transporter substrate-binding protein [Planctomycetota bacterium]